MWEWFYQENTNLISKKLIKLNLKYVFYKIYLVCFYKSK